MSIVPSSRQKMLSLSPFEVGPVKHYTLLLHSYRIVLYTYVPFRVCVVRTFVTTVTTTTASPMAFTSDTKAIRSCPPGLMTNT
ncbi:unnamed protein product [Nippostrongylus brasiliensis]|uniref:Uncharacterized protein n=1 Tax=Nippostrongylus brasiliensis TaxID=27835 RepID=A0A0N4XJ01_NIPBR|nr:unnamed protein product [Nippostrongylus brasiliensis]